MNERRNPTPPKRGWRVIGELSAALVFWLLSCRLHGLAEHIAALCAALVATLFTFSATR